MRVRTERGGKSFFFSSRRRHTRSKRDWSSDVCSSDLFSLPDGRVEVEVDADADHVVITVRDDGIGIASDTLPRVFERFWQADSTPDRAYGGLGLGLAIVKQIAEMHGGSVAADSPGPGHGATFTITLPVRAEPPR